MATELLPVLTTRTGKKVFAVRAFAASDCTGCVGCVDRFNAGWCDGSLCGFTINTPYTTVLIPADPKAMDEYLVAWTLYKMEGGPPPEWSEWRNNDGSW